ncbi:unnamed protein product [Prunus brigantina]
MNFREKLMNPGGIGVHKEDLVGMEEDKLTIEDDDFEVSEGTRGPCIRFCTKVMERLYRPWRNAIIIKLMGRTHTYSFLLARLRQKWSLLKGAISLIDLENNFYVVRFVLEEDIRYVFSGGPWVIAGQSLVMQRWKPGFDPNEATITRMAVWVRIMGLHVEWFNPEAIKRIGDLIGVTYRIDTHIVAQARGKYARICIELDLTKPLIANVQVENNWYAIEYEGLHLVCFGCGIYGHNRNQCPSEIRVHENTQKPMEGESTSDKEPFGVDTDIGISSGTKDAYAATPADSSQFGPWSLINGLPEALEVQPPVATPQPCFPEPACAEAKQIGETTKQVKGKQKAKGRPRKTLGDISNNAKEKDAATNTPKNRQVDFKPRVLKKTSLSNGFQVRNLDIQEEMLDGLSFNLNKYLKEKGIGDDHVNKPDIEGHDPP